MDDRIPPFLTVEEASRLLKIGRTKAYLLTKEWRATGGQSGLPVVDLGDVLRVPGPAIEKMLGTGLAGAAPLAEQHCRERRTGSAPTAPPPAPVKLMPDEQAEERAASPGVSATPPASATRARRPRRRTPDQLPLFQPITPTNTNPQAPNPHNPETTTHP